MTDSVPDTRLRSFVARCRETVLRPVRADDAEALFAQIHREDELLRWLCWGGPESVAELRERYASWHYGTQYDPGYMFAIERRADGAVIGEGSLRFGDHPGVGELGYWLGIQHHGRGHGRDAVEMLTRVGFDLCAAFALVARVKEGNEASIRVLNRTGYVQERAPRSGTGDGAARIDEIAWVFTATRRADERRAGRLDVRIERD